MRPTVLLFDIDGTLITTGGAGRKAIVRVFERLFGRADALSFDFSGMTDRAIVRRGLSAMGPAAGEEEIDRVLEPYLECLRDEVARATVYRLHDGMAAALDAAASRPGIGLGLGTGNIREGARVKLDRLGIFDRFAFGGFGSDHEDRTELVRIGARRGAETLGVPFADCRVVVIGDTPKDVAAAHGIGAESVAVATGHFDVAALRAAGATWAFRDLAESGAVETLIGDR